MRFRVVSVLASACVLLASVAFAQPSALVIKPLVEKKVSELPAGPLFWRVENFTTVAQAQAAADATGLVAEAGGKVWLFALGPAGTAYSGGTKVADIGPLPPVTAKEYLLRINEATGARGSITPVHTHPGSEAFLVLAGEQSQKTPHGVTKAGAGEIATGHGADTAMQVSSSGSSDLHMLVMFVVDATKPFSSPAKFSDAQ